VAYSPDAPYSLFPLALGASLVAVLFFYLGSRQQKLCHAPLPLAWSLAGGGISTLLALVLWNLWLQPMTAFFTLLTLAMALGIALPCLASLGRRS
jgi:hypothetical protein